MYGELVPMGGGDPIPLIKELMLVGRRESCDITLRFANVSAHHCELRFENGYLYIRDLGSSNGIKINGVKLTGVVTSFDNFCVLLRRDGHSQLVYKHTISTIMPGSPVQMFENEDAA